MELLSQMWSLLGLLTVLQNVLPSQLLHLLRSLWQSIQDSVTPFSHFDVPEFVGHCQVEPNELYRHVHLYLNSKLSSSVPKLPRLTLSLPRNSPNLSLTIAPNHSIEDRFLSHRLLWTHHVDTLQDSLEERRSFSLRAPKPMAPSLRSYLAHVSAQASDFERHARERRLHTNAHAGTASGGCWASVPFRHPATFDTLALDPALKSKIVSDLDNFASGGEFYSRVGRAWKRGYLLHGPPGSGKSSLIAAMANHIRYDVFDLELTKVSDNGELRALLLQTTNRSIIVVEDIDCSLDLTGDREAERKQRENDEEEEGGESRVTLSGLLNFTDGLWSCCGEERIIVFTTNHRSGLDPALVRAGRMDVHVRLGECGEHAIRELVRGYLGVEEHELLHEAENCMRAGGKMLPAEVGEVLLRNRGNADVALKEVVQEMQSRLLVLEGGGSESDGSSHGCGRSPAMGKRRRKTAMNEEGGDGQEASWEKRVKLLRRLRSLTMSRRGF